MGLVHSVLQECCPVKALIYLAFLYFNNRNNNKYLKNTSRKITYNFHNESLMSLVAVFCCRAFSNRWWREELKNRVKEKEIIPALLNIKEFCDYLGIGETKARELLHDPGNGFTVRIGNRLYAHRGKVDQWLLKQLVA